MQQIKLIWVGIRIQVFYYVTFVVNHKLNSFRIGLLPEFRTAHREDIEGKTQLGSLPSFFFFPVYFMIHDLQKQYRSLYINNRIVVWGILSLM